MGAYVPQIRAGPYLLAPLGASQPLPYRNQCSPSQGAYGSILVVGGTHPSIRCGWAAASDIREIDAQPALFHLFLSLVAT